MSRKRKDSEEAAREIAEGKKRQEQILEALESLRPLGVVKNREQWAEAMRKAGIREPAGLFKAILMALSERDENADICGDKNGNPEPDPELRDYENVPLKEDIHAYMEREVLPFVPDAWVDEDKTKIGYEISLNRYLPILRKSKNIPFTFTIAGEICSSHPKILSKAGQAKVV